MLTFLSPRPNPICVPMRVASVAASMILPNAKRCAVCNGPALTCSDEFCRCRNVPHFFAHFPLVFSATGMLHLMVKMHMVMVRHRKEPGNSLPRQADGLATDSGFAALCPALVKSVGGLIHLAMVALP